ncbi:hypothetical protein PMIT1313_00544 [Prochlorococcus marinus str. MIT 1313]|uniref:hypothetical protein n=1 Tax=Prochlorococcus sp. MIT 1313 TaxID=3082538 RepID=UPI0007BAECAE|nr:hypothetical protein PMIT1313_00544 [Prochlorococcus marinus str. MIT 1313]KZR70707.1 hypothetical protein PMIT1318_01847 [Prochlorococcus marinus str. MIT 1318]
MPPKRPDNRDFTHLGWQNNASSKATEEDHLVLHIDQPTPSGTPDFHEVHDAEIPSPTHLWPTDDEQYTNEDSSMIAFDYKDADQSATTSVFS